jgi:cation:H+ antiporter
MLDFIANPLWLNALLFAAAAIAVWRAGTQLAVYADAIADITGLGSALLGMLMLGGVTSLPEIAVTFSAGIAGDANLAVNNLLGGLALQVVVIAIADLALKGRALSFVVGNPQVLLQGVFCCLLQTLIIIGIAVGDYAFAGVGVWSTAIFVVAILLLWFISRADQREQQGWKAVDLPEAEEVLRSSGRPETLRRALLLTAAVAAVIFLAGFILARTGQALAQQTGLGSSFIGATLVGLATSLPEISTVLAAVRLRQYMMAFSDIFGTNILTVSFVFLVDIAYSGGPVLNQVGQFSQVAASMGILVTLLYVAGLIERRDDVVGRLGIDSWAVVVSYMTGVVLLYTLR